MSNKRRFKLPQTYHSPRSLPSLKISNSLPLSDQLSSIKKILIPIVNKPQGNESFPNIGLGSIDEYLNNHIPKITQSLFHFKKKKPQDLETKKIDETDAQRILFSDDKKIQKAAASKVIVEGIFRKAYGREVSKLQTEQKRLGERKNPRNLINMSILEEIMKEMQFNPRSHSVMIRKEELEKIRNEYLRILNGDCNKKVVNVLHSEVNHRIELFYRIKNQYGSLRNMIIPTRCEQYDAFMVQYSEQSNQRRLSKMQNSCRKKTFLITELDKENLDIAKEERYSESFQKFRAFRGSSLMIKQCPPKFQKTAERLICENINEITAPVFIYMVNQCCFDRLQIIRFRFLRLTDDLLFFFIDCLRQTGSRTASLESLEFSSMLVQNLVKFSEKMAQLFQYIPIRALRLQSLDLGTRDISTICAGLCKNKALEELSLRHNRIDILGVRSMQLLCRQVESLRLVDVRNNDIPHYANLKDKSSSLLFF